MKNVNFKKIKELCAKGAILLMLTGTITTVATPNTIYTVSAATKTLKSTKSSALKKLLAAYNSYDKSNYYSTQYKSITKYYNTGVTKINACKTKNDVSKMLDTYKKKMATVKDKKTVLAEYKIKMQKSLLENYKDLVENNNYDSNGLKELESIYNTYNSKINKTTTKTKAKKYKNTAISKMENVCTKVIVNADGTKTMSLEQVNKKVKALCEKYPNYTEDEIRTLYVIANKDEFNYDVYDYLNISSKEEMEEQIETIEDLFEQYERNNLLISYCTRNENTTERAKYIKEKNDVINLSDFIENEKVHEQCEKLLTCIDNAAQCAINYGKIASEYQKEITKQIIKYLYDIEESTDTKAGIYSINDAQYKDRMDNMLVNKIFYDSVMTSSIVNWKHYLFYPTYIYDQPDYNGGNHYYFAQAKKMSTINDTDIQNKLYSVQIKQKVKK